MRQIFESIFKLTVKLGNFFCPQISNSNNKIENHFHGPVNFISKQYKAKELRSRGGHLLG